MDLHLICLTNSGIPIFNRKYGSCDNLPFSTIGSLNGIHLFCKNQGVNLTKTHLENGLIVWEEFDDRFLFIGIANGGHCQENSIRMLLKLAYNAIILPIGQNGLQLYHNPERLKRELKYYLPQIDLMLEELQSGLIGFSDCLLSNENQTLLTKLNEFSEQFGSPYACLMAQNKIAVATDGWWDLDVIDRTLLNVMLQSATNPHTDVPLYLPKKSPTIAYRLISVPILRSVSLCVLCGAEPLYMEVQALAQQIYAQVLVSLQALESCYLRSIPTNFELDSEISGFLLINRRSKKCVVSRNIDTNDRTKGATSGGRRLDIVKAFYNQAVDFMETFLNENLKTVKSLNVLESYWSSDYYKLHALIKNDNLICIMYGAVVPIHTMRLISKQTLDEILKEKDLCF